MANEKALFTTQADFKQEGIGISVDPFLSYNADDSTGWEVIGTPAKVPGVKRNAESYVGSFVRHMTTINPGRHIFSFFVKPTSADVSATSGWRMLFTHRGSGQNNKGFHLAIYNGGMNARVYTDTGGSISLYSDSADQIGKKMIPDVIHHVIFVYDSATGTTEVWVNTGDANGWERWMYSTYPITLSSGQSQRLTVGDMPTGSTPAYDLNGWIDEFMYWNDVQGAVPTLDEIKTTYREYILDAKWTDWWTESGSMMVGKSQIDGTYTQERQIWESDPVDLGQEGFGDFGRIQFNYESPTGTKIDLFTRSSVDNVTWNDWVKVANDGTINSGNDHRYLQVKVEFWTTRDDATPKIMEIQVLDYPKRQRLSLTSEPLIIYRDLSSGLERVGELVNAYDIFITEEIIDGDGGEETIEFKVAMNDPKRLDLGSEPVELIAHIGDKRFILRDVNDIRDDQGRKYTLITGEALWYELRDAKVMEYDQTELNVKTHVQGILDASIEPTGWTIYKIEEPGIKRTIRGTWKSVLELILEVADTFDMEIQFDTINKTITMVSQVGESNGVRFYYNKNLKTIERNINTYDLITRLYLYGKNDMSVTSVHPQGLAYVENTKWVDALNLRKRIRIGRYANGSYTIPQNLYETGQKMIEEYGKPSISYAMSISDLSMLSGHEHETIGLGDVIYAIDTELLNMAVDARIVRRKYNVREIRKTEVELNQPKKTLADANQRAIDDELQTLAESDPLDTSDIQQMTVFNHLLNSRAEDGIAYWEQTGTGIEPVIGGYSGNASWKVTGGYGTTNILKQSLFGVSHRSAYTVSAYVANDGTITRGTSENAFVGIRVRIHYTTPDADGNTYEDHYLAIPDITQQEGGAV